MGLDESVASPLASTSISNPYTRLEDFLKAEHEADAAAAAQLRADQKVSGLRSGINEGGKLNTGRQPPDVPLTNFIGRLLGMCSKINAVSRVLYISSTFNRSKHHH
jgi:hypothetical protein